MDAGTAKKKWPLATAKECSRMKPREHILRIMTSHGLPVIFPNSTKQTKQAEFILNSDHVPFSQSRLCKL